MIPEIDIWRVANLMLKRYGGNAEAESARRADELRTMGTRPAQQSGGALSMPLGSSLPQRLPGPYTKRAPSGSLSPELSPTALMA